LETTIRINESTFKLDSFLNSNTAFFSTDFERVVHDSIYQWVNFDTKFSFNTSGSTGTPKSIAFERKQLQASAQATIHAFALEPHQTSLICLNPSFIAGQMMIIRSLENSMNMVAIEPCNDPLQQISIDEKIDFAAFVPYQLQTILESTLSIDKLNRIKSVIIGGAPLDEKTILKLQSLDCQVYATYGMTETITHVALKKLNGSDRQGHFRALKGVSLSLDSRSCLVIEAPYLAEKIVTNDIVELIDKESFQWLGRYDNIINSGGVKVIPEKVEATILSVFKNLSIHNRFFLIGMEDTMLGTKAVLVMEGTSQFTKVEIINALKESLSKYEVPKAIFFVPNFIETQTQKINRTDTLKLVEE
jgi:o-succinylbenzoate---CoA ligase